MSKLIKTFTADELAELKEYDKLVDKGEDLYPLTAEQKKAAKQATTTSTGVYTFTKRERKPNEDKREIVRVLQDTLQNCECEVTVTNPERELTFTWNGETYRLTLAKPRK